MGTPFYYKRWVPPTSRLTSHLALLTDRLLTAIWSVGLLYLTVLMVSAPHIESGNPFNLLRWPVYILVIFLVFTTIIASAVIRGDYDPVYRDTNIYHHTSSKQPEWTLDNSVHKAPPLASLVLSAGLLDEALMGLSIEPLVYGFLSPELKKRLTPRFWPGRRPIRSGEEWVNADPSFWGRTPLRLISTPVKAVLSRVSRPWVYPRVIELILDSASAAGFGLPPDEFSNAVLTPKTELKVPGVFEPGEGDYALLD
jgi:hypothetical protein